jgi:hypothetical protein
VPMLGADHRTPFHHHREGQPPLREGCDGGQARLPHLGQLFAALAEGLSPEQAREAVAPILAAIQASQCKSSCDACRSVAASPTFEAQEFCGPQPLQVRRGGANPVVRTWCDGRRSRRSSEPQEFCCFRLDSVRQGGANLSATGATDRFAPRRAQNLSESAAFRAPVRRVGANCEPGVSGCR